LSSQNNIISREEVHRICEASHPQFVRRALRCSIPAIRRSDDFVFKDAASLSAYRGMYAILANLNYVMDLLDKRAGGVEPLDFQGLLLFLSGYFEPKVRGIH
jgi:hypothetical protein